MHCPRCHAEISSQDQRCKRCGYRITDATSHPAKKSGTLQRKVVLTTDAGPPKGSLTFQQGRYSVVGTLPISTNTGTQEMTWIAIDHAQHNRRVLIREIPYTPETGSLHQDYMSQLIKRLKQVGSHPAIPDVLDTFSEWSRAYVVFEYIQGESLAALLKKQGGALPEPLVAEYGQQLCGILAFFARQHPPFVHGSISPETVVIHPDTNRVSLIHLPLHTHEKPAQSANWALAGYRAPEQRSGPPGPTSDLYTVAAILHHAVTGYDPHERMSFFYPPARRLNPTVSPRMEAILAKELRLTLSERYHRAADMQADLVALLPTYSSPDQESSAHSPATPATPAPPLAALSSSKKKYGFFRSRASTITILFASLALCLLLIPLLFFLFFNQGARQQAIFQQELAHEQQLFTQKGIGISDGRFVFDTYPGRSNVVLKQQAAHAIQQADLANAVNLLTKAVDMDPTDGEAQIYNENVHVLQSKAPYITIVLGLAFDKDAVDLLRARIDTQAAFIIQHEVNKNNLLPHGLKLRLLIASAGSDRADVATVAQLIARRVTEAGNSDHIIGVVGWPFSSQTINARDIIASAHLPLVSQTASSVKLSGSSPYFFRVNPADDQQGKALGKVAVQQLQAKTILVTRDPTEPYSVSLADSFTASARRLGARVINSSSDYFTTSTTTVEGFHKVVQDALANEADLIFIAGFDVDAVRLAHALGNAARAEPASTALANLSILGGDGLATALVLGQGQGADAQIAAAYPQDMRRLICTSFGDPNEWAFLQIPQSQQPTFFATWAAVYQSSAIAANQAPPPGNDALLTADAVQVLVKAITLTPENITGQSVRDALASLGKGNIPPFQGVSGRILFDSQGNPVDKAIVILAIERGENGKNVIRLKQVVGTFR
ncbi:MAG: ABC transporter substrate-binding protein [Ktedonobacteraceae bacterium]|nr:ABC transporter substrate-binding protein [Ktedonobacteraceae bacterium]